MKDIHKKALTVLLVAALSLIFLSPRAFSTSPDSSGNYQILAQAQQDKYILVDASSSTSDLVEALEHSTLKYQRRYAAQLLGDRKEVAEVPHLVQALQDPEEIVQKAASESLANIGDKSVFPALLESLHSSRATVREYSAYVLGRLAKKEDTQVVHSLEESSADQDKNVRTEVIYALYEIGSSNSRSIFVKGLYDPEPRIRSYSANALGNLKMVDAVDELSAALDRETDDTVMRAIVSAVGKIGGRSSAQTLAEAITNETPSLRIDIANALAEIKTPEATRALMDLLADNNPKVRASAATALIGVRDPASMGALAAALKDRAVIVRRPASEALIYVANASVIGDLVSALGDPDPTVADNATKALIQVNDLKSVNVLIDLLGSENSNLKTRALTVLEEITHRPYGADVGKWTTWYQENFKSGE